MSVISMKQLLEAGVHFGHQTRRWNPKMKPYIFTERNGIHVIDLQKTVKLVDDAYNYVRNASSEGAVVLFVGTKKQASEAVKEEALRAGQYYVNHRWLGGMLTNWNTIQKRVARLKSINKMEEDGTFEVLPKKEVVLLNKERERLEKFIGGIADMPRIPDVMYVVDPHNEQIAIQEAQKLGIPVVAMVDTNADPDPIDVIIPANDDAIRAVKLITAKMADAIIEGRQGEDSVEAELAVKDTAASKESLEELGAGIMDAKRALVETDGNMEAAAELLREKGIAKAEKKADRIAAEGLTGIAVNGNTAALIELNSETDFVAKNEQFVAIVKETAELIAEKKPATNEEALALTTAEGISLEDSYTQATATIGEKISFRRFQLIEKTDAQTFGVYQHNQGRIGVVTVVEGGDAELAKAVAMHIAAMNPTVLSYKELDAEFVHDELAKLNHTIDEDNESRKLVNKPMLPHLAYGSRSQLTEEVLANAEAEMKEELLAEGKPEAILGKIIPGKVAKFIIDNTKVDQAYTLLGQLYVMDDSKTVEAFLESKGAKVVAFTRYEVGEGIEKAENNFAAEVAEAAGLA